MNTGTTKPKGIGIAAILTMLLLIGSISVAGASGDDYSAENFYVDEDTAWMHADVYLTEWIADETPGLEDWDMVRKCKKARLLSMIFMEQSCFMNLQ